ncbi:MAG: glucose-1-phosphate adenylyltransferase, partial [Burkholderiaceae bacterium]|nr:glucose-1-phosphate adenylyltransferase [Burkholderiaceae bacterium]
DVHGVLANSLVSGGCIVSGSQLSNTILFSRVRVHSFCVIDQAVILPGCQIHRHCRLRRVVIDRGCEIPEGMVIGENPELDAKRFYRSPNGVVLVTQEMLAALNKTDVYPQTE